MNDQEAVQRLIESPTDQAAADRVAARIARHDRSVYDELRPHARSVPPRVQPQCAVTAHNHSGEVQICARELHKPTSIAELRELLRNTRGQRVRAVATMHSFSDILDTDGVLIDVTQMFGPTATGLLPREDQLWREPWSQETLVRVACSAQIHTLRESLATAGLGFANLGGFAGQTLIGAISTSTHGSGITLPPLPDIVRSLDLVTTGGEMQRIEPTLGVTDPKKFAQAPPQPGMTLVQDDDTFDSVLVSLGCMGVITSALIAVTQHYRLRQQRTRMKWSELKQCLQAGVLQQHRHVEVLLHPYARNGDHDCLLTVRDIPLPSNELLGIPMPKDYVDLEPLLREAAESATNGDVGDVLAYLMSANSTVRDAGILAAIETEASPATLTRWAEDIFDIGPPNYARVSSAEYAVPVEQAAAAMDRLLQVAANNAVYGLTQTSPFAMRFVAPSRAFLSMMYGRATCMVETPIFLNTPGRGDVLRSYETALIAAPFNARPHWGQVNALTGGAWWRSAYPKSDAWLAAFRRYNAAGTFDNQFTDRMGISRGQAQ